MMSLIGYPRVGGLSPSSPDNLLSLCKNGVPFCDSEQKQITSGRFLVSILIHEWTTLKIAPFTQNGTFEDSKGVETIFAGCPFSRSDIIALSMMRDGARRSLLVRLIVIMQKDWILPISIHVFVRFIIFWVSKRK
jgi:hypothetical protein